jgi:uncharacterized membrane protein
VADGVFHAASWVILLAGVVWLYRRLRQPPVAAAWPRLDAGPRPWRALVGPMLMGWGLFNLVEGLVDHHLLGLHHVRPGPGQLGWDIGFLASGVAIAGLGFLLARRGPVSPTQPADAAPGPPTTQTASVSAGETGELVYRPPNPTHTGHLGNSAS